MAMTQTIVAWCPHLSYTGAERPVLEMGRMPVLWTCDQCGKLDRL